MPVDLNLPRIGDDLSTNIHPLDTASEEELRIEPHIFDFFQSLRYPSTDNRSNMRPRSSERIVCIIITALNIKRNYSKRIRDNVAVVLPNPDLLKWNQIMCEGLVKFVEDRIRL